MNTDRTVTLSGLVLLGALALLLTASATLAPSAGASPGADRFWAGEVYRGEFGAPSVLRVDTIYYAYATNGDGDNLPMMTSTDLVTWRARNAWPKGRFSSWAGYNDAMPFPARWAVGRAGDRPSVWAPAVAALAGRYVDAYAMQLRTGQPRHCLTLATSARPTGPFRDRSKRPLYCSSDPNGSIDPAWLQVHGNVYLIWKNAGVPGHKPTQVMVRRMTANGLHFAPGSRAHVLLQTARPWEGNVIEAPSAVSYAGRIYLFYSGNIYTTGRYAIGYAVCRGPLGPCRRGSGRPLLATGGSIAGPGAESPFVDLQGRLRLAYSAWTAGHVGYTTNDRCRNTAVGCNQRRLHVATLQVGSTGRLTVGRRG